VLGLAGEQCHPTGENPQRSEHASEPMAGRAAVEGCSSDWSECSRCCSCGCHSYYTPGDFAGADAGAGTAGDSALRPGKERATRCWLAGGESESTQSLRYLWSHSGLAARGDGPYSAVQRCSRRRRSATLAGAAPVLGDPHDVLGPYASALRPVGRAGRAAGTSRGVGRRRSAVVSTKFGFGQSSETLKAPRSSQDDRNSHR
jgi:hypothetical protein